MTIRRTPLIPAALLAVAVLATACAPADEETTATSPSPTTSSETVDRCAKENLQTFSPGELTIATDQPVFEPWFVDDDPTNQQGFEGAAAYAIAEQLGYSADEVTWVRVPFNAAIQPGPKTFDFDINEFSITEERREAVDFSSPYYDVSQAVITIGSSPAADATSLADLKDLKIGAQVGTTSFDVIEAVIAPNTKPAVFNTNDDAKKALENGQIDALVVDLPTAFFITAAELDDGKIVGQLESPEGEQEQFGLVLDKNSPLTECVSEAVDALRADGTLDRLVDEWLSQAGGAPVLS